MEAGGVECDDGLSADLEPLVEPLAAAMFEVQPGGPRWEALMSWAAGSASKVAAEPNTAGWRAAQARGEKPFEEARDLANRWRKTARTALAHLRGQGRL